MIKHLQRFTLLVLASWLVRDSAPPLHAQAPPSPASPPSTASEVIEPQRAAELTRLVTDLVAPLDLKELRRTALDLKRATYFSVKSGSSFTVKDGQEVTVKYQAMGNGEGDVIINVVNWRGKVSEPRDAQHEQEIRLVLVQLRNPEAGETANSLGFSEIDIDFGMDMSKLSYNGKYLIKDGNWSRANRPAA